MKFNQNIGFTKNSLYSFSFISLPQFLLLKSCDGGIETEGRLFLSSTYNHKMSTLEP